MFEKAAEPNYWSQTLPRSDGPVHQQPPTRVDIAVVGAGFTGLGAALAAARRGASVAVFERHFVGWGASSRNGGMVLSGLKIPIETLIARYGSDRARRLHDTSLAAIDHVERLVAGEAIACDFHRFGHIEAACKPGHLESFRRTADLLARRFSHQVRIIEPSAIRDEIGSAAYHGGLLDEKSAGLNPAAFVRGLGDACRRAGAAILEATGVRHVEDPGTGRPRFVVTTERGRTEADVVILAAGAYTGGIAPALQRRIVTLGSYVIATEPLDDRTCRDLLPRGRMVFDSKNFLHYYRLTPDRRMLFGGRAAFFPESERTVRESAAILRRDMIGVFPQLQDAVVAYAWGGTLDFTYDLMPHAGAIDGMRYAIGYAGHGIAMATYLGAKLGAAALGDAADDPLFDIPLPSAPLRAHALTPWLLPLAGAWYKLLDWAG